MMEAQLLEKESDQASDERRGVAIKEMMPWQAEGVLYCTVHPQNAHQVLSLLCLTSSVSIWM